MKRVFLIPVLLFYLTSASLSSEEIKTRDDFSPPPPSEKPLTDYLPDHYSDNTGLWISAAGTLGMMGLSLCTAHNTIDKGLRQSGWKGDAERNYPHRNLPYRNSPVCGYG